MSTIDNPTGAGHNAFTPPAPAPNATPGTAPAEVTQLTAEGLKLATWSGTPSPETVAAGESLLQKIEDAVRRAEAYVGEVWHTDLLRLHEEVHKLVTGWRNALADLEAKVKQDVAAVAKILKSDL